MAGRSILRRIVTWPRLLYLGIGFAAGLALAGQINRPSDQDLLDQGYGAYLAHRVAQSDLELARTDCTATPPDPATTDATTVRTVISCAWTTETQTHVFETGYAANGTAVFSDSTTKERLN
ncbi:hypothetical protein [Litoreibacter roseus]|uniref:Uncharacterized protein n=1 Tax=Litoreibacter roseus TaxID=2601869 RepID=A0A6N6JNB4_9RHOB|nr:hypothetical protein [Litoreibacter roseus]GFE66802.1 hypothetical protein KIN_38760 [Litoreibacter roseus]